MNKKDRSERDICTKYISPAVKRAGWDEMTQMREEVSFTKGRITTMVDCGAVSELYVADKWSLFGKNLIRGDK